MSRTDAQCESFRVSGTLWEGSVAVASDGLGMTCHRWDHGQYKNSIDPEFAFSFWRTLNVEGTLADPNPCLWSTIHTASSTYDWTEMDTYVDAHWAAGRQAIFTVMSTPNWASSDLTYTDIYGVVGGSAAPTSMTNLTNFITTLVARYNNGDKKLYAIEIWNEPDYVAKEANYFTGTAADMAEMAKAIHTAAKAQDAAITVYSPGFYGTSYLTSFLNASDGAAGFGRDYVDRVSYHIYGAKMDYFNFGTYAEGTIENATKIVKQALDDGALDSTTPIDMTETGFTSTPEDELSRVIAPVIDYTTKARYMTLSTLLFWANGWGRVVWHSYDSELAGRAADNQIVMDAGSLLADVVGNTLQKIQISTNGALTVTTDADTLTI